MANQIITRVIPKTLTLSFLCRLRPLAAAAVTSRHILLPSFFRALSTRPTTSSLNDQTLTGLTVPLRKPSCLMDVILNTGL